MFKKRGVVMKKQSIILGALLSLITSGLCALTDAEAQKKGGEILQNMVNGHNKAFGVDNLLKTSLDLGVWNAAMAEMKTFVDTIINEHKNFLGLTKDAILNDGLNKVTKAEMDLVNTIKVTRGVSSSADFVKQIETLTKIINDMIAVQKTFTMASSSPAKNEAQKVLKNTALFIETTASKARKDANAAYNPSVPSYLPPMPPY